jgi:hypothetical protein
MAGAGEEEADDVASIGCRRFEEMMSNSSSSSSNNGGLAKSNDTFLLHGGRERCELTWLGKRISYLPVTRQ